VAQVEGNNQLEAVLASLDDGGVTRQFYWFRDETLAWNGSREARSNAKLAQQILSNAAVQGLDRDRYSVLLKDDNSAADDVAMSAALLKYMHDLSVGCDDLRTLDADVDLQRPVFDAAWELDNALRQNRLSAMLSSLEPRSDAYAVLKAALAGNPTIIMFPSWQTDGYWVANVYPLSGSTTGLRPWMQ
jgi:L,D-transpeptidase YcbB